MSLSSALAVSVVKNIDAVPHILKLVSESTGLGFVCIAHVTPQSWTACAVHDDIDFNLDAGDNLEVSSTLCDSVRAMSQEIVIECVNEDPVYRHHPVTKQYGFQSYFSYPLYGADDEFFGTLCGLDKKSAELKTDKLNSMVASFAALISRQLATAALHNETRTQLFNQREAVKLREQNIAILGHDLRTPLSSISVGLDVLENTSEEPQTLKVVKMMRASSVRISRLISDVMDFAHTRVNQGVTIEKKNTNQLASMLSHIVKELQNSHPDAKIIDDIHIEETVICDADRLCQLLSNLLINALVHGDSAQPVQVQASVDDTCLRIVVENYGPTIPAASLEQLFQPFWRHDPLQPSEGLGLGLFIASEISKVHGGELVAHSEDCFTQFSFTMPL